MARTPKESSSEQASSISDAVKDALFADTPSKIPPQHRKAKTRGALSDKAMRLAKLRDKAAALYKASEAL